MAKNKLKKGHESTRFTAKKFIDRLQKLQSDTELNKILKYFKPEHDDAKNPDKFIGVKMGQVFALAKEFISMDLSEIEKLLESPYHEVRTGGVSIMDFQARNKKTSENRRKELFDLYINRHDRINNWDLVDRSAPYVVGGYLQSKPRKILYKLATSKNPWERRTAIVATYFFIRNGEIDDTFKIAEILIYDNHDLVNKATGSWLRTAGIKKPIRLLEFLDQYAPTMPRVTLRYAVEKLKKPVQEYYMKLGK
jgi:3-methyladenine DNA glycosylase AlkD